MERKNRTTLARVLPWFATIAVLAGWWFALAPSTIGGSSEFVLVNGTSMEPMLHTGDLVVAKRLDNYNPGDLVVINVGSGKVIHRIHSMAPNGNWVTKGDNNKYLDPFEVPKAAVHGVYWFALPGIGGFIGFVREQPLLFAAIISPLGLLPYLPRHRRRLKDELRVAMRFGSKEPRRDGRTNGEYGLFAISVTATTAVSLVSLWNYQSGRIFAPDSLLALAATTVAYAITGVLIYRLYDGYGVAEPSASMYALTGRLYLVEEFPSIAKRAVEVDSAVALRNLAEEYRLPILHRIDPTSGHHSFLLITEQRGCFIWRPPRRSAGKNSQIFGDSPARKQPDHELLIKKLNREQHRAAHRA